MKNLLVANWPECFWTSQETKNPQLLHSIFSLRNKAIFSLHFKNIYLIHFVFAVSIPVTLGVT